MTRPSLPELIRRNLLAVGVLLVAAVVLLGGVLLDHHNNDSGDSFARQSQSLHGRAHTQGHAHADAREKLNKFGKHGVRGDKRRQFDGRPGPQFGGPLGGILGGPLGGPLPKALRDDLQNLRKADPSERAALQHQMFAKALGGDYGDLAQKRAQKLKELVDGK